MSYCVEVWGNSYKSNLNPVFLLQKRAIRIIKKAAFFEPTNALFINLYTLKFWDIVSCQTLLFLYRANHNLLPSCLQKLFQSKENKYELRNKGMFEPNWARTNTKKHCITVKGVSLWQSCDKELKKCSTLYKFKKMFKSKAINNYRKVSTLV